MNRRGFFGAVFGGIVGAFGPWKRVITIPGASSVAITLPPPTIGTYGAIERATFSFWRNQQVYGSGVIGATTGLDALSLSMREAFNEAKPK